jgi:tetratricopeptide (TPR) repeat protein
MKQLTALCLLAFVAPIVHAGGTLKDARHELLRGNYSEARAMYADLAKVAKDRVPATIGLSRAHQYKGDYADAQKVVDDALKATPDDGALLARRAELLYLRGQKDAALKTAKDAIAAKDPNYVARWVQAQVLEDRGDVKDADEELRWFIRAYNDNDIPDLDDLTIVGLGALQRARLHHLGDQFQFVLDEIFTFAAKADPDYWPAEYEKGRLFMEKHDKRGAHKAFERALTINPRAAEVLVAKGQMAAAGFETKDAEQFAEQALKINPNLTSALRLMADVQLFSGETEKALRQLEKARAINPREEETLARIAACLHAQKKDAAMAAVVKEVEKHNPKPHVFYAELADQFDSRKLYYDAEKYYETAVKLRPELPAARAGLGLLYMRLGEEAKAKKLLEEAFEADNYNVRVRNTLKVLDHLAKYDEIKTDHFLIRYDPKNDAVLARYMAKYLEEVYDEYAKKFDFRPKGPILIEVFNKHEMFSGRVTALPDLHTIGACTGVMFAMVSPHDTQKVITRPFNWVRVIRHELVHVFNLDQTKFQVPHWFTEGLAVTLEGSEPPPSWNYLLAEKVQADDLLNLDTILLGFVRPRSQAQWHQAYMQSKLYVDYLRKKHGEKAVGKLLAAFADGLETGGALEKAVGEKKEDFEKGYRAFITDRAKNVKAKATPRAKTLKALKEAHEKNPDDLDIAAELAERQLTIGRRKEATELADDVLRKQKTHPIAATVKARLLIDAGDSDIAYTLLEAATADGAKDIKPLKLLGKMQFDAKKFEQAAKTYERCRELEPFETSWLIQLAKAYQKTDNQAKLMDVYKELVKSDPDELLPRKRLAKHYADAKDHAQAEHFARMALQIDVVDRDSQDILLEALAGQNKEAEAKQFREIFGR